MNPPRLRANPPRAPAAQGPAFRGRAVAPPLYRVRADRPGVERQRLGAETRVRVPLSGAVDENWRRAYRLVQLDSTGYFRYRLELGSPTVTFTGRDAEEGLVFLMSQLDAFLDLVNARASAT